MAVGAMLPIPFHEGTTIYRIVEVVEQSAHAIGIVPILDFIMIRVRLIETKVKQEATELTVGEETEKVTS